MCGYYSLDLSTGSTRTDFSDATGFLAVVVAITSCTLDFAESTNSPILRL